MGYVNTPESDPRFRAANEAEYKREYDKELKEYEKWPIPIGP
jgi:hypothetical protein